LTKLMANLVKPSDSFGLTFVQPVHNIRWIDLVAEYSRVSGKRVLRIPLPGRLLLHVLGAIGLRAPSPLMALLSEAKFKNKVDSPLDQCSTHETLDDVGKIIKSVTSQIK